MNGTLICHVQDWQKVGLASRILTMDRFMGAATGPATSIADAMLLHFGKIIALGK